MSEIRRRARARGFELCMPSETSENSVFSGSEFTELSWNLLLLNMGLGFWVFSDNYFWTFLDVFHHNQKHGLCDFSG